MTSSDTVIHKALPASAQYHHARKVGTAITSSESVKPEAYRSASSAKRGFCDKARSSSFTMCASRVWLPTCSAWTMSGPDRLSVPAVTRQPALLATGRLSPVSMASLISLSPRSTTPSTGTVSPARTTTASSVFSETTGNSSLCSLSKSMILWQNAGTSLTKRSAASPALCRADCSINRPASRKNTNMAMLSKYMPCPALLASAEMPATNVSKMAMATGVSMPVRRLRKSRSAPMKKGWAE